MGQLADKVLQYLHTTPSDQLRQDWEDLKQYNQGPDILSVLSNYGRISLESPLPTIYEPTHTIRVDYSSIFTCSELYLSA